MAQETRGAGIPWGRLVLLVVAMKALLVALAFGWVAVYSHGIHTGESAEYYQAYAQQASPWVAVVAGLPLFFGLGVGLRRWLGSTVGLWAFWGISATLDVVVVAFAGSAEQLALCALGVCTSLLMLWLGARWVERRPAMAAA